ncbi:hypothetical protein ACHAWO_010474 [Cyclotella atomus]|uniref:Uncharacterized protein n=1 Tax=Cyclotella atomus TaxID=382360 RepID=A0ABD3Q6N5_9STRA
MKRRWTAISMVGYAVIACVDGFAYPFCRASFQRSTHHVPPLFSSTPGDEIITAGLIPYLQRELNETKTSSPTIQIQSAEDLRQRRRAIITRRRQKKNEEDDESRSREDYVFLLVAVVPFLLAFLFWENISLGLATFIDEYGAVGRAADGNQFANSLIRPTITGVVVPVISIALATLLSNTVNILRDRQLQLRSLINKEACDLRLLRRAIFGIFGTRQHAGRRSRALGLMTLYVEQLDRECQQGSIEMLENIELSGGIATNELDRLSSMLHGVEGAAASRQGSVEFADDIIARLNEYRSDRVALLLTDFPDLHWVVLSALSVSICIMFLLESNQSLNQYLNSIQLRSLFALLVGVFSTTATLCLDLDDPFTGSFSINSASAQIGDLRLCLQEDFREANSEHAEISSRAMKALRELLRPTNIKSDGKVDKLEDRYDDSRTRTRFSLISTIYFHLLTGPLGSNVRAAGDVLAWVATAITNRVRLVLSWTKRWKKRKSTDK